MNPVERDISPEARHRLEELEDDVKSIFRSLHGEEGLKLRVVVLEARLQLFWWAIGVTGSVVIGLVVQMIFSKLGVK